MLNIAFSGKTDIPIYIALFLWPFQTSRAHV